LLAQQPYQNRTVLSSYASTKMASPAPDGLRADAKRNRGAVLAAARAVFAESGLDAPLDAIARRAGVGRATLYRRFPTRDDLVAAIHEDNLDELERVAAQAPDPDGAFLDIVVAASGMLAADRGFVEHLRRRSGVTPHVADRFLAIIDTPLRRARRARLVREDLRPADVLLLLDMIGGAAIATWPQQPEGRGPRVLELLLDGVRPRSGSGATSRPDRRQQS
jgi:AcrR family transcriptional regulator